ncbi:DgyrCDS4383 [Dimorphilus gyrociliatus]|uniref:DgyrCDS4383 n=1 Tax=Dimorphilus gyrociliatus TaxID=2664684 RepID=A0A7I8VJH1_9ANNE|nr:DgyrCDS4383 [Dimorphilus gyrociliatus]
MTKHKESSIKIYLERVEELKKLLSEPSANFEIYTARLELQDLYKKVIIMDVERALDNKLEQELWTHAFKNHINDLQAKTKNKSNPKRIEMQATLNLFLEAASGFYTQLLLTLCHTFRVNLPFMTPSVLDMYTLGHRQHKGKNVAKSSVMILCQHCLVHLGDIARYRHQANQAETYYRHAITVVPSSGQPFNQLAILASQSGNKLLTVFYHVRSLALKYPFRVAINNLEKVYHKYSDEINSDIRQKMTSKDFADAFVQLHGLIHLNKDFNLAKRLAEKVIHGVSHQISTGSFSTFQLLQLIAINVFSINFIQRRLEKDIYRYSEVKSEANDKNSDKCEIPFWLTVVILENMLSQIPKQEAKVKDFYSLPAIKMALEWLLTVSDKLSHPKLKESSIWKDLSKLLNCLQFCFKTDSDSEKAEFEKYPLEEDFDLQCFMPLTECMKPLDFTKTWRGIENAKEMQMRLRCTRLVEIGLAICDKHPSLTILTYEMINGTKYQFSVPAIKYCKVVEGDIEQSKQTVAIQADPDGASEAVSSERLENRMSTAIGTARRSSSPKTNIWLFETNEVRKDDTENVSTTTSAYSLFPTSNWLTSINTANENFKVNEASSSSANWPMASFPQATTPSVLPSSSGDISKNMFSDEKETSPLAKLLQDQRSKSQTKP